MWMKLLCLMMLCRGLAADELLDALVDVAGGYHVSLCMGGTEGPAGGLEGKGPPPPPALCTGVLWHSIWVIARSSCLERRPLYKVRVLRDREAFTCADLDAGKEVLEARKLRSRVVHPDADADLTMLALDRRYWHLQPYVNYSAHHLLNQYAPWMEEVYSRYPMDRRRVSYAHNSSMFSSPLRMFITTILVPSIIFMAIFVYVIFFTGPNDDISYKNIKYEESETSVKCL